MLNRISEVRQQQGVSQLGLADTLGIRVQLLAQVEDGLVSPSLLS